MLQKKCSCRSKFPQPRHKFSNNGPLLDVTEQKDPEGCIAFPVMSLRVVCFCYSFPFCFAFAILS